MSSLVYAQQPASPQPFATGNANFFDSVINTSVEGDEHGAAGRTYVVLKANLQVTFIQRANIQSGYNPLPAGMPLSDAQFWPSQLDASAVSVPNGTAPPTGTVGVAPFSDGRVYNDPYSPCGNGQGHWIMVEMANLTYSNQSTRAALIVGISNGEDPNPADSGVFWTFFAIATVDHVANVSGSTEGAADFPEIGFNTNWIVVTANDFFKNPTTGAYSMPLMFVFNREQSECNPGTAAYPISPAVLAAGGAETCTGTSGSSTSAWYCNDSNLAGVCPAVNYHTTSSDPDGGNFFAIKSVTGSTGTVQLYQVSGSVTSPTLTDYVQPTLNGQPGPGGGSTWASGPLVNLQQFDTTEQIQVGPDDDRFSSCVVRNSMLYAAHNVATPATNPTGDAIQWWQIGLDSNKGRIYDFERVGGGSDPSAVDPSIAVNHAGNVLVGFLGMPGVLSSYYLFKSHSGCLPYQSYLYAGGLGAFFPNGDGHGNLARSGDYSQTVVDPSDDSTFWTTEGWASSSPGSNPPPGGGYGWLQSWAFICPNAAHLCAKL